jgi:hypothetical protein
MVGGERTLTLTLSQREREERAREVVTDVGTFGRWGLPTELRGYQVEVARAVVGSVLRGEGLTFTVLFPRQAGKNELSAQLEAFLMFRRQGKGGSIVKAAPTFKPQIVNSLMRLERMLEGLAARGQWRRVEWRRVQGYIVQLGTASCTFFSAQPDAGIVGGTANLLLEGDEAQDIEADKWDRELVPMGASGNATRVLYGTPWTDDTLLAREIERNLELERRDGLRRHFEVGWEAVAAENPAYRRHVEGEIARLGEHHPIVQTQYLLRPLSRADRLLSWEQLEKLRGEHPPLDGPADGSFDRLRMAWGKGGFVAGIDVAGADEEDPESFKVQSSRFNASRDSTVLTVAYAEDAVVQGTTRHGDPFDRLRAGAETHSAGSGQAGGPVRQAQGRRGDGVIEPKLHVVRQYAWRGRRIGSCIRWC